MSDTGKLKGRPKGKLKNGHNVSCYIRHDIYDALLEHCQETGQTKTVAIERAIMQMVENNKANRGGGS